LFIVSAFVIAGFAHSAWLRSRWSAALRIPIDGGLEVRGRRLFGDNKTIRGFVVMIPAAALAFAGLFSILSLAAPGTADVLWPLSRIEYLSLGAWAGFGFMAGELPNSFVKRQLDIAPGQPPRNRAAATASFIVDRLDSIIGMLIALSVAAPTPWKTWVLVLAVGPAIHLAFSILLHRLGVKARAA
jgi:CDP-2,3-bis-(O-geranylgeranyl)-sn-glycerol synthase